MFGDDHKKTASVILAGLNPKKGFEKPEDTSGDTEGNFEEGEGSEGLQTAADEMIAAIHAKDGKGLKAALSNYLSMHSSEPDEDD